mmetsp:Transcript_12478/g.28750  ORF Transcript_12478/g.28750 Transcript_12478/m.28750 type:complete len:209 (-) Transcript_12478:135-761(-)
MCGSTLGWSDTCMSTATVAASSMLSEVSPCSRRLSASSRISVRLSIHNRCIASLDKSLRSKTCWSFWCSGKLGSTFAQKSGSSRATSSALFDEVNDALENVSPSASLPFSCTTRFDRSRMVSMSSAQNLAIFSSSDASTEYAPFFKSSSISLRSNPLLPLATPPMTALSRPSLREARWSMNASYVFPVTSRYTLTCCFWPMRWHLLTA